MCWKVGAGERTTHVSPWEPGASLTFTCIKSECPAQARMGGVGEFAKSRPAAKRPGGPKAQWPTAACGPLLIFHSFCLVVTPRTCKDLHQVWVCNMDSSEFEFVYHFNNHLNHFRSFLSLLVVKWKTVSFSFYSSVDRTRQREIALSNDSNDLMVNKFTNSPSSMLHTQTRCRSICACVWSYHWTKTCGKSGLGRGPSGHQDFGLLGRWPAFSKTRGGGGVRGFQMTGA